MKRLYTFLILSISLLLSFPLVQSCGTKETDTESTNQQEKTSDVDASSPQDLVTQEETVQKEAPIDTSNPQDQVPEERTPPTTTGLEVTGPGSVKIAPDATYHMLNSATAAIGILTEQKDRVNFKNVGSTPLVIKKITILNADGEPSEEFQVCKYRSATHECLAYELPTLAAGKDWDIYLHFLPIASGERSGSLKVEYEADGQTKTFAITLQCRGRMGDDKLPAKLLSKGQATLHKLWGGYHKNHDEAPGPMVVDAQGNMYLAGTATGHIGSVTGASRNIFIVKVKADGDIDWANVYHTEHHDMIPQTGDNLLLGASDAMTTDTQGNVYLVGQAGNGATNKFVAMVMKLSSDGSMVWVKYWYGDTNRLQYTDSAIPFAVAWHKGTLFVTAQAKSDIDTQGIAVFAMGDDGSLKWSKMIIPKGEKQYAHRGHSIKVDTLGDVYVSGIDYTFAGGPFVAKLTGGTGPADNVTLAWAKTLSGPAKGSSFSSMDLDSSGNVFLATELRPAGAGFVVVKISSDGSTAIQNHLGPGQAHVLRVFNDTVYAGGTTRLPGWDTQRGDGLFVALAAKDLSLQWGGVYFTGKRTDQLCSHSVHGIQLHNNELYLMGQVYTGNSNFQRYWGYWYDIPQEQTLGQANVSDSTKETQLIDMKNAGLVDTASSGFENKGAFEVIPASFNLEYQNARDKNEATHGSSTDADVFLMKIPLTK